jgi:hypothetical protein
MSLMPVALFPASGFAVAKRLMAVALVLAAIAPAALLSVALSVAPVWAQDASEAQQALARSVHLQIDVAPDSITVGDPIAVKLVVRAAAETQVQFAPEIPVGDAAQMLDFTESPGGPADGDGMRSWTARYTLGVYAVGENMLPPIAVLVQRDSVTTTVSTDSIFVFVESVLDDSLAAADMLDIKGQQGLGIPWPIWAWALIGAAIVAALLLWSWWYRRRRRPTVVPYVRPKPADVIALAALRMLEEKRLPLDGHIKEHYVQLSDILRAYLEAAPLFRIPALEETTDEIVMSLRDRNTSKELIQQVQSLCEEADLVKFAKHQPPVDECMQALQRVDAFVRETAKPAPVVTAPEASSNGQPQAASVSDSATGAVAGPATGSATGPATGAAAPEANRP